MLVISFEGLPTDRKRKSGPDSDVIVKISDLVHTPGLDIEARQQLARSVIEIVNSFYPATRVICFAPTFYTSSDFWTPGDKGKANAPNNNCIRKGQIPKGARLKETTIPVTLEDWKMVLATPDLTLDEMKILKGIKKSGKTGYLPDWLPDKAKEYSLTNSINSKLRKNGLFFGIRRILSEPQLRKMGQERSLIALRRLQVP